jgi:hypothetical protein
MKRKHAVFESRLRPLGRLQRQCRRAFIALGIALTTRELASWFYPRALVRGEKLPRWRIGNMARAAKSIGARPGERVGQQRMWRLGSSALPKGAQASSPLYPSQGKAAV